MLFIIENLISRFYMLTYIHTVKDQMKLNKSCMRSRGEYENCDASIQSTNVYFSVPKNEICKTVSTNQMQVHSI